MSPGLQPEERVAHVEASFATTIRNVTIVGALVAVASELLGVRFSSEIPPDPLGTSAMSLTFLAVAIAAQRRVSRAWLVRSVMVLAAVLGWYHARLGRHQLSALLTNQGAFFVVIAGTQAVLPISVGEFLLTLGIYLVSLVGCVVVFGVARVADFAVLGFYALAAVGVAAFGIVGRTRLQQSQQRAHQALERLNLKLESKVSEQVQRIRRAEVLRRFLPPEVTDRLLATGNDLQTLPLRREVAVLCAAPSGLLESLSRLEGAEVVELVNAYVTAMSQLAFEHGGVVERVVGPRMTVLFGAIAEVSPQEALGHALRAATTMQQEAQRLLLEWEKQGFDMLRLRLAVGIAYGPAVVGTFGSERRSDYSALGSAMMRAVRLSSEAIPGEIRLDDVAAQHVSADFELTQREPVEFSPGEPVQCFSALALDGEMPGPECAPALPTADQQFIFLSRTLLAMPSAIPPVSPLTRETPRARTSPRLSASPSVASTFDGRYLLEATIGRGGMATVYRARHLTLGQIRALKVISQSRVARPDAVEQFRREAEATARVHHPNVVRLHDFGRSLEGHYYLVLDFIDGPSLAQELERTGPLSRQSAARIGLEVLEALAAAHARNLVHQDLKPSNVMLDQVGSAHVTDFGLVTFRGTQTTEGSICGTPAYMSPEQWTNRALDGRSDLYAWGVMMFEMLSGGLPLFAGSIKEFAGIAVEQAPPSLTARAPQVPVGLARLIDECLAKQPSERPNSALVVAERLREWHDQAAVPRSRRVWPSTVDHKSDVAERSPQNEVSSMPKDASACTITLPSKGS